MSDKLRAASERLRERQGDWRLFPYPKAPDDFKTIAEAWLAENPADDDEPTDADFVRSLGKPIRDDDAVIVFLHDTPDLFVRAIWEMDWTRKLSRCLVSVGHQARGGYIVCETRGKFRRLCLALGIALVEQP